MEREANSFSMSNNAREWKSMKILGAEYIISTSLILLPHSWKISVSNLVEVWTEIITREIALARCQSLNPLLDLDSFDIDETLNGMFNDIPKYATDKSLDEIKLESCIDGIAFRFNINLTKGSPQQFWNEITKPLCQSSMELNRRHKIVLDLIKKKDEELLEYKLSGAQLTRKNIETLPYNKDIFGNEISVRSSRSADYVVAFQSMMDLYNELNKRESLANNVHNNLPQGSGDPNRTDPDRVPKREKIEASEMILTVDVHNSNELQPRSKIKPAKERLPICESVSIVPKTEIIEQYEVGETSPGVGESKNSRTQRDKKKKLAVNNTTLSSVEQPSTRRKRPKISPNIYDFIA